MLALADPDLDHGPRTDRSATMRMCAVTREVRPIGDLIRFVVSPQGEVVPDLRRRLPGRGLWVSASRQVVADAVRRHQFSRGFKRDVKVSLTLPEDLDRLMARGTAEALAMAAKAGQVVAGYAKVETTLLSPRSRAELAALIHASDGSPDGIRKLDALARQGNRDGAAALPIMTALTSAELDLALGRTNVIHAALLAGPASKTFLSRSQSLVRYRLADADKTAGTAAGTSG